MKEKQTRDWVKSSIKNKEEFFKHHHSAKDLIPEKLFRLWDKYSYNTRCNYLYHFLKNKLKEDPDYEVFVPFVFPKFITETTLSPLVVSDNVFISNKGRVWGSKKNAYLKGSINPSGYKTLTVDKSTVNVHRAVAFSFCPIPEKHKDKTHHVLEVNHMDCVKINNGFSNLEWCTGLENKEHAVENGLQVVREDIESANVIPMLATVKEIKGYEGKEFIIVGLKDAERGGMSHKALHSIRTGKAKSYKGCDWEIVPKEDVDKYPRLTDETLIEKIKNFQWNRRRPNTARQRFTYVGTCVTTGEKKEYRGTRALELDGFLYPNVLKVIKGERAFTKGYSFEKIPD